MCGREVCPKGQGVGELAGKFITEKLYIQGQFVASLFRQFKALRCGRDQRSTRDFFLPATAAFKRPTISPTRAKLRGVSVSFFDTPQLLPAIRWNDLRRRSSGRKLKPIMWGPLSPPRSLSISTRQ